MEFEDYVKGQSNRLPSVPPLTLNQKIRLQYSSRNLKNTLSYEGVSTLQKSSSKIKVRQVRSISRCEKTVDAIMEYSRNDPKLDVIFSTLETILQYETRFPAQVARLVKDLKSYIYVDVEQMKEWMPSLKEHITDAKLSIQHTHRIERTLMEKEAIPVCSIYTLFVKEILNNVDRVSRAEVLLSQSEKERHELVSLHEKQIAALNTEVTSLRHSMELMRASNTNIQLQSDVTRFKEVQKELIRQNEKLANENVVLSNQNEVLQRTVTQLNEMISTFKNDYREKTAEMEEYMKQFKNVEGKIANYKDLFDKGLYKMILLRNESRQLNDKINDMHSENSRLARRAAVSYDELTPRPAHRKLFKECQLDYDAIFPETASTESVTVWLVEQVKRLYDSVTTFESMAVPLNKKAVKPSVPSQRATQAVNDMIEIKQGMRRLEVVQPPHFNT